MDVNRICWYLQGTKEKGLVFNTYKKIVVDCYTNAYLFRLWGNGNPQDSIFDRIRTGFVVTFDNFPLLWV